MIKYIPVLSIIFLFSGSCKKENDTNELAEAFCECSQPIVEWSKGLDYHYEKLKEGAEIRKKVSDCLEDKKKKYAGKKGDAEFQKAVAAKVNEQCPEANTTLQAMFEMLFRADE